MYDFSSKIYLLSIIFALIIAANSDETIVRYIDDNNLFKALCCL